MVFKYLMGIIMQTMRYATFCLIFATGMSAGAQANEKLSALIEKAAGGQVTSLLFTLNRSETQPSSISMH